MKKNSLDAEYWNERYIEGSTGWDIGYASPPIISYFSQVHDVNSKILIPGAGRGFEAVYLYKMGFKNIHILDYASEVIEKFKVQHPDFPINQIIEKDFFEVEEKFDFIVEQTFFCALHPEQRLHYLEKMESLLAKNGKLVGVLFANNFDKPGPPYGGTRSEYMSLFSKKFRLHTLDTCYNSIPERQGNELFFIFQKINNK